MQRERKSLTHIRFCTVSLLRRWWHEIEMIEISGLFADYYHGRIIDIDLSIDYPRQEGLQVFVSSLIFFSFFECKCRKSFSLWRNDKRIMLN